MRRLPPCCAADGRKGAAIVRGIALLLLLSAASGCDAPEQPGRAPADGTAAPLPTDAWLGRWTGPEGLFLDIAPGGERGRYRLTVKGDLDSPGDQATGIADGGTIRFERRGAAETIRPGDGGATGLKWLADKKTCLIVKSGEGYCRG